MKFKKDHLHHHQQHQHHLHHEQHHQHLMIPGAGLRGTSVCFRSKSSPSTCAGSSQGFETHSPRWWMSRMILFYKLNLKGSKAIFLSAQSFYWPQTKRSLNRQFSPKSPKVGKNRVTLAVKLEINGFQPICLPLCGGRSFSPLSAQLFCPAGSEAGIRG